jgi:hypothetical protein
MNSLNAFTMPKTGKRKISSDNAEFTDLLLSTLESG